MYSPIDHCRICGNTNLVPLFDLGNQALTGVFPSSEDEQVGVMPMQILKCVGDEHCGLVQMKYSGAPEEMYGMNYGYRSGLNQSMVNHLTALGQKVFELAKPNDGDIILDIGSNDATLLKTYEEGKYTLVGMDPTGVKFKEYYTDAITLISDFFSAENFEKEFAGKKAKIVTSIAMFYDLEDPQSFVNDIAQVISDDGIWMFEMSYLPLVLTANAYDSMCHEHLEYYAMRQIHWLLEKAGMFVLDAYETDANGGSICVVAAKKSHPSFIGASPKAEEFLQKEEQQGIHTLKVYEEFWNRVQYQCEQLRTLLDTIAKDGKKIFGLGASTKGNVLLQYCNISSEDIPYIAEVNEDKFGCFTPGTNIPIISQQEADDMKPDYYIVFPWHFRTGITKGM
ncbi:MAG: class I SAM-dependent methyltransferase, partial [Candidatus Peribacteraceae bacterium]|nr:class I SAM-dependent methyltransferase [Candidatus Peribacteraceae bacterium]